MAYEWQSDIIRPDGENGTEILDGQGVYQPQIEGGDNITIENGRINASGTLENVQADYTETDSASPSYIKHKPDLSVYATASGMETALAGKQDVISDLATIRSGAEAGSTAVQPGDLAAVATTGSYTSLSNTPQNIVQDANYVHTDNNFSNADVAKLSGIAAGAEVNVQSDWNEADSTSDAFIKNKPTIPAAQVNSDWNASSGVSQILNKPDLSAYATDSELADGLATKQNVISDLDTIRSGASAGATAVQPSQLPSSDELVPSATSVDAGKVLTVGNDGTASWITPSAGTVYTPGDGIDITNDVISADVDGVTIGIDSTTKQIKSLQTIPTKTSDLQNDSNFVVASSLATVATTGSYSDLSNKPSIPAAQVNSDWNAVSGVSQILNKPNLATVATTGAYSDLSGTPTIPTVDQTYSAASTNAQSGVAVAQAIASIPSASYTAGDGIAIESGEISVDYDSNTLDTAAATITESVSYVDQYDGFTLPSAIQDMQTQPDTVNVTVHIPANTFKWTYPKDDYIFTFAILNGLVTRITNSYVGAPLSYTEVSSTEYWIDEQDIVITLPTLQTNGWEFDTNLSTKRSFNIVAKTPGRNEHDLLTTISDNGNLASPVTFTYQGGSHELLTVKNPLPASTSADANKVLKVNASGNAEWGTDGFTTTAGITDIQVVASLPASPDANTLYLIPEA